MLRQNVGAYSVQIMSLGASRRRSLEQFLRELPTEEVDNIFVYRADMAGAAGFGVLYGTYASLRESELAIGEVARRFGVEQPYLRTLQGLRREIGVVPTIQAVKED